MKTAIYRFTCSIGLHVNRYWHKKVRVPLPSNEFPTNIDFLHRTCKHCGRVQHYGVGTCSGNLFNGELNEDRLIIG